MLINTALKTVTNILMTRFFPFESCIGFEEFGKKKSWLSNGKAVFEIPLYCNVCILSSLGLAPQKFFLCLRLSTCCSLNDTTLNNRLYSLLHSICCWLSSFRGWLTLSRDIQHAILRLWQSVVVDWDLLRQQTEQNTTSSQTNFKLQLFV
jgi:hypothetical protein